MSDRDDNERRELILPVSQMPAVIRETDGYVDKTAFRKRFTEARYDYLASITDSIGNDERIGTAKILALLVPDQEYIAIEQYKLNYGDIFRFTFYCPVCGHGDSQRQAVDLSKLELRPITPESTGSPDPTLRVLLPRSDQYAEVGMLTGEKELTILKARESAGFPDMNLSDHACLRTLNGSTDFTYEDIIHMKGRDKLAIREAREKLIAGYDTMILVTCPDCGFKMRMNMLEHQHFFLPGA